MNNRLTQFERESKLNIVSIFRFLITFNLTFDIPFLHFVLLTATNNIVVTMHRHVDIFYDERSMKYVKSNYRIKVRASSTYKIYKTSVQTYWKKSLISIEDNFFVIPN